MVHGYQKIDWLGVFGVAKHWYAMAGALVVITVSGYSHHNNRLLNRMIQQQYWSEDESKMHTYFRVKNLERGRLFEEDDEYFRLKLLDAGVKKYPFGLNPRSGWRKHSLIYNAKVRGKLPVEWVDGDPWPWEPEFAQRFPDFEIASGDFGKLRIGMYGMLYYDRDEKTQRPRTRAETLKRREEQLEQEYEWDLSEFFELRGTKVF